MGGRHFLQSRVCETGGANVAKDTKGRRQRQGVNRSMRGVFVGRESCGRVGSVGVRVLATLREEAVREVLGVNSLTISGFARGVGMGDDLGSFPKQSSPHCFCHALPRFIFLHPCRGLYAARVARCGGDHRGVGGDPAAFAERGAGGGG